MTTEIEFIHLLLRWFLTPFCLLFLYAAPMRKYTRVSHEKAQFVLKIAHLATVFWWKQPDYWRSYGLLPRLWHLICSKTYCSIRHHLLCLLIISTSEPRASMQSGLSFYLYTFALGSLFSLLWWLALNNSPAHERVPSVESKTASRMFVFWELRRRLQSDDQVHGKMIKGLLQLLLHSIKLNGLPWS